MRETWVWSLGWEDPWRRTCNPVQYSCLENPWTEEPGGLQSRGSQRVGHDWATSLSLSQHCLWASQAILVVKNLPTGNIRDADSIPGWGRFPGRAYGNPLHYSCLENHMYRRAWRVTVHRVAKIQAWLKRINMHACKTYQELEPVIGRNNGSVPEGWVWTSFRLKTPKGHTIGRPLHFHEFQFQEFISEEKFPLVLERGREK